MNEQETFREKANHYVLCYFEPCEQKHHCLRWLEGQYAPTTDKTLTCVNVMNKDVREGRCPMFRPDEKVVMMRGFKHLFDDMPRRIATAIRIELDAIYGHTTYYKYRKGKLPISPKMQRIAKVCQQHGWMELPVFDETSVEYKLD